MVAALVILPFIVFVFDGTILTTFGNNVRVLLIRITGSAVFWIMAMSLVGTGWGKRFVSLEPVIFFVFCIHPLIIDTIWRLMDRFGLDEKPWVVIFYFFMGPLIVLTITVALVWLGTRIWPQMMRWLGGGRIPTQPQWQTLRESLSERVTEAPVGYVDKKM